MVDYHDTEWGVPVDDDTELFERLALESFQAGLSWTTILRKREAFRAAFRGFDPVVVAAFGPSRPRAAARRRRHRPEPPEDRRDDRQRGAVPRVVVEAGSFANYLAEQVPGPPTRLSESGRAAVSRRRRRPRTPCRKDLRMRGFSFVGSTIVYAFMQSVGLVDDHLPGCFRYRERDRRHFVQGRPGERGWSRPTPGGRWSGVCLLAFPPFPVSSPDRVLRDLRAAPRLLGRRRPHHLPPRDPRGDPGVALAAHGPPWYLVVTLGLYASWSALGTWIDLVHPIGWRDRPGSDLHPLRGAADRGGDRHVGHALVCRPGPGQGSGRVRASTTQWIDGSRRPRHQNGREP